MNTPSSTPAQGRAARTPLWASFVFSFVNSIGTFVVTGNALYFLTKQGYSFSDTQNFLLAVLLGGMYILGAVMASKILGALWKIWPSMSHRGLLGLLMLLMAALCAIPQLALWMSPPGTRPAQWIIWLTVLFYSPLTGVLWPLVESYVSGGRRGSDLRSTMGWWNVVWCGAGLVAIIGVAPLVEPRPALAVMLVGVAHGAASLALFGFAPHPAEHADGEHDPHPPVYTQLLVTFRILLPMAYAVNSALAPYLPDAAEALKLPESRRAMLNLAWIFPRVVMFGVMQYWQAWHGRWYLPIAGGVALVIGFGAAIIAPSLGTAGTYVMVGGLALFGVAMAVIYTGAIYYAMEVGNAGVDAGGTHEALIGVGYTVGPAIGLTASLGVDYGVLGAQQRNPVMLGVVLISAIAIAGLVMHQVARRSRPG